MGTYILLGICGVGKVQISSISLHKNVTALEGRGRGEGVASPADPALLLHFQSLFFQTYSKTVTKNKSHKLWVTFGHIHKRYFIDFP